MSYLLKIAKTLLQYVKLLCCRRFQQIGDTLLTISLLYSFVDFFESVIAVGFIHFLNRTHLTGVRAWTLIQKMNRLVTVADKVRAPSFPLLLILRSFCRICQHNSIFRNFKLNHKWAVTYRVLVDLRLWLLILFIFNAPLPSGAFTVVAGLRVFLWFHYLVGLLISDSFHVSAFSVQIKALLSLLHTLLHHTLCWHLSLLFNSILLLKNCYVLFIRHVLWYRLVLQK